MLRAPAAPPTRPTTASVFASQPAESSAQRARGLARVPVSVLLVAGVLAGFSLVVADACARSGWPHLNVLDHVLGSLAMYAGVGALIGCVVALLMSVERALVARPLAQHPRLQKLLSPAFFGLVAGLASTSTAIWTFSGEHVQATVLSRWGPPAFAGTLGACAALGAAVLARAGAQAERGKRRSLLWALAFFAAGALVSHVDLTVYVSLYSRVHTLLEFIAALLLGASYALVLVWFGGRGFGQRAIDALGKGVALWLVALVSVPALRTWLDDSLKHVWLEEVYVGRMLRRVQVAEAFLADPLHWRGMRMARIERLKARYSLGEPALAPEWSAPLAEEKPRWDALRQLRGGQPRFNVIVYYVDTLRSDVARDAETMPALARFRARSLDFARAYAAGSDTLRSLPVLTGGNFDALSTPENDLLRVAKRAGYDDALAIGKSAYEFISKLRPDFYFDQNLIVEDYPAEQQVWGYGAQQPTAPRLVDRALGFLAEPRKKPFFLWLFNFDQHNWRELDSNYVEGSAKKYGISDDPAKQPYRYRAVARAIDHEFDRLLRGLAERKLGEKTIVLFVSDHGEALGRDGFWVHSVFLWESLIRVPLVLHVPGLPSRRIDSKVSLVDVAPTLGRYLDPTLDGAGYQGEDLLSHLLPTPFTRRFPLLLTSASKDLLVRVGLVDPVDEYKLVLSFEAALPELYDLREHDPDSANFATQHAQRVRAGLELLLHSPVFPRTPDDFEVRDTRAQRALESPSEEP